MASGILFIFGGRRFGAALLRYSAVAVVIGGIAHTSGISGSEWRNWLPDYVEPDIVLYGLYAMAFLVAMNFLRHFLALFVGYGAANSATGNLLSTIIVSVATIVFWPLRALRRLGRASRQPFDDAG